ncbi:MAG: glycosyltransferase family 4 protein [Planctomycetota bacterium]
MSDAEPTSRIDDAIGGRSVLVFERGMLRPRRRKPVHGVELFRIRLLGELAALGVQVTLVCERSWAPKVRELGGEGIRVLTSPYLVRAAPTGAVLVHRAKVAARRRGRPFDVLVLGDPSVRQAWHAAHLIDAGVAHRTLIMAHGRGRTPALDRLTGRPFDVHAVSHHVAEEFRGRFEGNLTVGYGIAGAGAFESVAPACDRPRLADEKLRCVLLARLPSVSKGEDTAREAWRVLPESVRARAELHLVGYLDPPAPDQQNLITSRWVPNDRVPELLASMHVMLVPSTNESFCQSMAQAMLVGLPVVCSPLPVLAEKVDTGGGRVCETPAALAGAIAELERDDEHRMAMGRIARQTAHERYVWDTGRFAREVVFPEHKVRRDES